MHLVAQNCSSFIKYRGKIDTLDLLCSESMLEDLEQLYGKILVVHPNPFQYCSKSELDSAFIDAKNAVRSPKNILQFSAVVSNFLQSMRDSHTFFNLRDLLFLYSRRKPVIPFYIKEYDNKFYLSKIWKNHIPVGAEILKVGSFAIDSLYKLAQVYTPYEANTLSARKELNEVIMGNVFNLYHKEISKKITFEFIDKSGDTVVKKINALSFRKLSKEKNWYPSKDIEYNFYKNKAYLRIHSFEPKNELRFIKKINRFFQSVEGRSDVSVYIDIRDNKGGYILLLEHLLSHINSGGGTFDLRYQYKRSELDRFETLSRLKKMDFIKKAQRVYPKGMISKEYDFYRSPMGTEKSILYKKDLKNRTQSVYKGNCTLVTNGLSMSASVLMASWFKEKNRGQLIGTPCFGSQSGTSGNPASIFLDNSGLPVSISTLILRPNNSKKDQINDMKMDLEIIISLKDIRSGTDPFEAKLFRD